MSAVSITTESEFSIRIKDTAMDPKSLTSISFAEAAVTESDLM